MSADFSGARDNKKAEKSISEQMEKASAYQDSLNCRIEIHQRRRFTTTRIHYFWKTLLFSKNAANFTDNAGILPRNAVICEM